MDKTHQNINKENYLPKILNPGSFYFLSFIIFILIVGLFCIFFDINLTSFDSELKSHQEIVANTFIILFFSLLILGICILFLPNLKDFKNLFGQIGNVTFVIIYTIFAILFYSLTSKDILNTYSYIINPIILGLGAISFYKSSTYNYVDNFNINYERIKMLILLFCLITFVITFYNINPGGAADKYFGYSLLLTIILSVFAFLYLIIVMTLPGETGLKQPNLLSNFSSIGIYGSALFILFIIGITILITSNKDNFFSNKHKSASVMILLLVISIVWIIMLSGNLFSGTSNPKPRLELFKNSLLVLFGLIISGLLIFWLTYNIENLSGESSIVSFILNSLIVILVLGLIYKTIFVKFPSGDAKKNAFFNLIGSILFYIPCLVSGGFDWIGKIVTGQYNSTDTGSLIMLFSTIVLIIAYFTVPSLFNSINTQGGKQLVNRPVQTDTQYSLGTYQDLNGSDTFDYQYAISCWVFIDSAPPNTAPSYNKYTSLLNFGNKPNITYNAKTRTLKITMQQKDLQNTTKNRLIDFDEDGNRILYINDKFLLQKWNNIIINYNGGTLDIFLNGELVKSSIEVVPYYTLDNLTIGENDGIKGGICNVVYFRRALTSNNIYYLYNLVKYKTPPVLNDSNETILANNVNQTINSVKTITN